MVLAVPGVAGVQVYVLGPPRNTERLKKERPSSRDPETYVGSEHALTLADSFFAAVSTHDAVVGDELAYPFDQFFRKAADDQGPDSFFAQNYVDGSAWRKIDHDWLNTTSDLALALDSDTNNTSLVLAFELGDDGDILLFPADAQVGNWLSWHDVTWEGHRDQTADDLLGRTIFYKVAHHGSHNATLRALGLEKMTHAQLVAMVPVDEGTADKQQWAMPFPPLWERLQEQCQGRVLRSDEGEPDGRRLARLADDQREAFRTMVKQVTDLFIDIEFQA
jgi:hypothetical protein